MWLLHLCAVAYEGCASFNTLDSVGSLSFTAMYHNQVFLYYYCPISIYPFANIVFIVLYEGREKKF